MWMLSAFVVLQVLQAKPNAVNDPPPRPGDLSLPEAWYRFEVQGSKVADATGHGHDGHLEGGRGQSFEVQRGVPGHAGFAYDFGGRGGAVVVPASPALDFLSSGTISAWVRLSRLDWHHPTYGEHDVPLLLAQPGH